LLPVLLTVALLCVDFGRFAHTYVAVTNAARAGAGYGCANYYSPSTATNWNAGVQSAVTDELSTNAWFNSSKVVISQEAITETGGYWRVQVTVTYPFQTLISWPFLTNYNKTVNLQRTVVMRGTI
jgi:Flp pilus assembly protein TadG